MSEEEQALEDQASEEPQDNAGAGAAEPPAESTDSADPPPGPPPSPNEKPAEPPEEPKKPPPEKEAEKRKSQEPVASPSDFPLYDSAVLKELREADARAAKAAKAIESVREQLAVYANKEEMTEDDIKMMQAKQEELMEKMTEFEDITKRVQHLVGLVDVASSQLGPPEKPMVPMVEGVRTGPPGKLPQIHPEDTLPKVIVCGTGEIDQVPKIIVCEPTKARDGKHPLYQQIQGSADPSKPKRGTDATPPGDWSGHQPYSNVPGQGPYSSGFAEMAGPGYGMPMPYLPGMGPPGPEMMGMASGRQLMYPPMGMGIGQIPGPFGSGPQGMMPPGMQSPYGGGGPMPLPPCPPQSVKKKKEKQADKEYRKTKELCEKLTASLKMTEKLAEENTELEGSRYQLQEAVLNKDKQYEGLMLQLDSLKMELKNVVNENQNLKKLVNKKGQGDQRTTMEGKQEEKTLGLCKKDLQNMPICKAEVYKEMGLPVPGPGTKANCPGAKFAASMGWNENQGCRNELNKSMCGADKKPIQQDAGQTSAYGSGDVPVVCKTPQCLCKKPPSNQQPYCKKSDMAEIVQTMEQEVKSLQKELELVQAERRGLALQKKLLQCMADAGLPSTNLDEPTPTPPALLDASRVLKQYQKPTGENSSAVELQLSSLREQYRKLQEDYTSKVEEVSMVRVEYDAAKRDALALLEKCREAESRVDDLLQRLRVIEQEKSRMAGSKDQMTELEQQLTIAKQRYREGQEELEELKTTMQDQMLQLEEYRSKYLSAQQTVEEQRRQIDIMELENNRISEQVNLEIQRVKAQFQEKLQELTPLPDMLKATQLKLQECDQLKLLAERNVEQLMNQMDELRDQNQNLEKELDELKKSSDYQSAEKTTLKTSLTTGEKKIEEIKSENNKLRATVARLEEVALSNERRLDEKNHEVLQLQTQLETLREESARQVSRTKDRCEAVRRTLQSQISQLECQLAQSRAAARTAQKDRDEVRQRMQAQITSLNDNFEQAQLRIRSLQSHVNYLKSSYTNIFAPEMGSMCPKQIDSLTTF